MRCALECILGAQIENIGIVVRVVVGTGEIVSGPCNWKIIVPGISIISILEVLINVSKIKTPVFAGLIGELSQAILDIVIKSNTLEYMFIMAAFERLKSLNH
jgi:hypothetical protein